MNNWNTSEKERELDVEGTSFKVGERGNILYEIIANWEQGTVHYAVKINVQ
ncbi:hypothetical protein [Halalkalibacillus sediminis]|uniref:hypothetical protein n=1 Tax=Halalkalibacillus sediminis TaxID=2018042 RepID=UPI00138FF53E|nr:hypothetical protein [Halalkalibacillus sediminis]